MRARRRCGQRTPPDDPCTRQSESSSHTRRMESSKPLPRRAHRPQPPRQRQPHTHPHRHHRCHHQSRCVASSGHSPAHTGGRLLALAWAAIATNCPAHRCYDPTLQLPPLGCRPLTMLYAMSPSAAAHSHQSSEPTASQTHAPSSSSPPRYRTASQWLASSAACVPRAAAPTRRQNRIPRPMREHWQPPGASLPRDCRRDAPHQHRRHRGSRARRCA